MMEAIPLKKLSASQERILNYLKERAQDGGHPLGDPVGEAGALGNLHQAAPQAHPPAQLDDQFDGAHTFIQRSLGYCGQLAVQESKEQRECDHSRKKNIHHDKHLPKNTVSRPEWDGSASV